MPLSGGPQSAGATRMRMGSAVRVAWSVRKEAEMRRAPGPGGMRMAAGSET